MTLRLALRSLATRPVRSAVLACGFGFGIAVMAALLGVGEMILQQARSPALEGGGHLLVSGVNGVVGSARFVMSSVLSTPPLAGRAAGISPSRTERLYLVQGGEVSPVRARGGIPSLEKAIGDPETAGFDVWGDAPSDRPWTSPNPGDVLREMDRFHPIPEARARADSWAEWLYFNGRADGVRFYLTFLVGPRKAPDRRTAVVRLQLEREGRLASYSEAAEINEPELLADAPDVRIGRSRVRLEGLQYRVTLRLNKEARSIGSSGEETRPSAGAAPDLSGELTIEALPGRSVPPIMIRGAGGWLSGYVVPVLSGPLRGKLVVGDERISLEGGTGYHDHNWGFWEGVSWQWGQVAHGDLSLIYGRIRPPSDAADPARIPGFLAVLGPEGPLGFSTDVMIEEAEALGEARPQTIAVRARGESLDLRMDLAVENAIRTRLDRGPLAPRAGGREFFQLRAIYRVVGHVGQRTLDFTAPGSAETFRGQ